MSQPKSIAAYGECEQYFDQACAQPHGLAVTLESGPLATRFMQKMNTYREKLRKQSRATYPPDDPRHGSSPYDQFKLTADKENPAKVLIKPYKISVIGVEPLGPED